MIDIPGNSIYTLEIKDDDLLKIVSENITEKQLLNQYGSDGFLSEMEIDDIIMYVGVENLLNNIPLDSLKDWIIENGIIL